MILPAEFERKMKEIADIQDIELRHLLADETMEQTLESLGYGAGTKVFDEMDKWYAQEGDEQWKQNMGQLFILIAGIN